MYYVYEYLRAYATEHGPVGSPYYIGKGKGNRAFHRKHIVPVPKDKSYIIFVAQGLTEDEAFQMEKDLIAFYGRVDLGTGCLLNRTDGGEGASGTFPSKETRAKMSTAQKGNTRALGNKLSKETRTKMSASHKGNKLSSETRAKISAALKGKPKSVEHRAKTSASLIGRGHPQSEETRAKISSTRKQKRQKG